ncbi:hypothetical protein PSQ20_05735 [Curvibacter sp. RS43]|uniref:hypothetical protein n=1 Tax=Curvibacter microcysteis TaxID=3026419 RepID=UPI00235E9571|nr:hypothetical protein [Curvibacter sp. RS43]MDD0809828.1 hypothetical protein [Curvibacter sp. RS43]
MSRASGRWPGRRPAGVALALWACLLGPSQAQVAEGTSASEDPMDVQSEAPPESDWRLSGSTEAWGYTTHTDLASASLLNPGNRLAGLPREANAWDLRVNARAEQGPLALVGAVRLLSQSRRTDRVAAPAQHDSDDGQQWGQAFARYRAGEGVWTVGRELLSWGPANFRSPSNPFYFDAGRTNPLAATPGVDLLRYSGPLAPGWRGGGGYVFSTSQISPATDQGHSAWLKLDQQGPAHLLSLVLSQQRGGALFVGGFAQWTPDDAWLLYAEFGSTRQRGRLQALGAGPGPLFRWQQPAPRSADTLLGASYTLESGHVLTGEWLHSTAGYSQAGQAAYWAQAQRASGLLAQNPALADASLGQALGQAPRLLGRDYAWVGLQSNPQQTGFYWRLEYSSQWADRSGQVLLYAEKSLGTRLSAFAVLGHSVGGVQTEFGSLVRDRLTLGLKWFVL